MKEENMKKKEKKMETEAEKAKKKSVKKTKADLIKENSKVILADAPSKFEPTNFFIMIEHNDGYPQYFPFTIPIGTINFNISIDRKILFSLDQMDGFNQTVIKIKMTSAERVLFPIHSMIYDEVLTNKDLCLRNPIMKLYMGYFGRYDETEVIFNIDTSPYKLSDAKDRWEADAIVEEYKIDECAGIVTEQLRFIMIDEAQKLNWTEAPLLINKFRE